jgi:hypothetical protein
MKNAFKGVGNMKLNTYYLECVSIHIIMYTLLWVFLYIIYRIKTKCLKNAIYNLD